MKKKPAGDGHSWEWGDETETGQASGEGGEVVFDGEFSGVPKVCLTPWMDTNVWLVAVSTTGFTWGAEEDTTIDWIAHNG